MTTLVFFSISSRSFPTKWKTEFLLFPLSCDSKCNDLCHLYSRKPVYNEVPFFFRGGGGRGGQLPNIILQKKNRREEREKNSSTSDLLLEFIS